MRSFVPALLKLAAFLAVTALLTGVLAATIANSNFGDTADFHARFTNASALQVGDDVRIAGVKVGQVRDVAVTADAQADVGFDVAREVRLPKLSTARVRFRNLVGQRYLEIGTSVPGTATLAAGDTIPVSRTQPALDLTELLNGFKPLFAALQPDQVNQLAAEIIQVFQGQSDTVEGLLTHTASLTSTLADKDRVIGQLVDNLNAVVDNLNVHSPQLVTVVDQTQRLVSGLAAQRKPIGDAITALRTMTGTTAGLLADARPPLAANIRQLGALSGNLAAQQPLLDHLLRVTPGNLAKFTRPVSYGSWLNFFLCNLDGTVGISSLHVTVPMIPIPLTQTAARCKA